MNALRVLLVSNAGDLGGGGELSLLDLVSALDRSRVKPLVVCPESGSLVDACRARGVPVEIVPFPAWRSARPAALGRGLAGLAASIRAHGARVVHCNATWRLALATGLVGRRLGIPVVWHVRVADRERWKDALLARLASRIVVNSDAVARRFAGRAAAKVERIHNGIDVERFAPRPPSPTLRAALGLPPDGPLVGSVGRFVAYKGYDHLLDAAAMIARARPDVAWLLVGDGELRAELEARARARDLARVRFAGWQARVEEALALLDVFVLPSLGEHFGRVLVEAMAMERPVVATRAGGVPEIVRDGETGRLVPPADPTALADAVQALLADGGAAREMGRAGRLRVLAEFTLDKHVAAIEALWNGVVHAHDRRL